MIGRAAAAAAAALRATAGGLNATANMLAPESRFIEAASSDEANPRVGTPLSAEPASSSTPLASRDTAPAAAAPAAGKAAAPAAAAAGKAEVADDSAAAAAAPATSENFAGKSSVDALAAVMQSDDPEIFNKYLDALIAHHGEDVSPRFRSQLAVALILFSATAPEAGVKNDFGKSLWAVMFRNTNITASRMGPGLGRQNLFPGSVTAPDSRFAGMINLTFTLTYSPEGKLYFAQNKPKGGIQESNNTLSGMGSQIRGVIDPTKRSNLLLGGLENRSPKPFRLNERLNFNMRTQLVRHLREIETHIDHYSADTFNTLVEVVYNILSDRDFESRFKSHPNWNIDQTKSLLFKDDQGTLITGDQFMASLGN